MSEPANFQLMAARGLRGRCPQCGEGRLFRAYLKPVDSCSACGESFAHIRADDGPAWLTILVIGHILGLAILTADPDGAWPLWASTALWISLALFGSLAFLPRAKGLFIALIWRTGATGIEAN